MLTKTIKLAFMFSFLIGCATTTAPQKIYVPVATAPSKIKLPNKPYLPIASLNKDSTPDVVMKSYVASLKIMQGYTEQLRKLLIAANGSDK